MKKIKFIIALAAMALTWTSCTKDEDKVEPKTKTELITAHTWKLNALTVNPAYNGFTDIFANEPCFQDNSESYSSNGSFVQNEGTNVCNSYSPTNTGTWSFNSTETILQTDYDNSLPNSSYNILELSDIALKYSGIYTIDGEDYTLTFTFTAQ